MNKIKINHIFNFLHRDLPLLELKDQYFCYNKSNIVFDFYISFLNTKSLKHSINELLSYLLHEFKFTDLEQQFVYKYKHRINYIHLKRNLSRFSKLYQDKLKAYLLLNKI